MCQISDKIWPIMPSLEYPASFRSIWDPGPVHQGPKIKIFKKWKKHSQAFTQAINVARFSDLDHLPFPRAPRRFPVHLGSRTEPPRSKIKNIQKMKKKKKTPQGFIQALSVPNLRRICPFMASLVYPESFRSI